MELTVTPWKESSGACDCCGKTSKTIWGEVFTPEEKLAVYYAQWTVGSAEYFPNIDLVLGRWGQEADPKQRILVSLTHRPGRDGGGFMVIDSEERPANDPELCGRTLERAEVIGTFLAEEVFQLVDIIWLQDSRIEDVKDLDKHAWPIA